MCGGSDPPDSAPSQVIFLRLVVTTIESEESLPDSPTGPPTAHHPPDQLRPTN